MSASPRSAVQTALAADRLGAASVASFALTAAAPLMVVGGLIVAGWANIGISGFPLALVLIGVVLALFCFGYVAMARRIPNAGAFYAYISQGLGRPIGVGFALVALLAYNALQFGLFGIFGAALSGFLESKNVLLGDKPIQWWVIALVAWAVTALFGVLRVDLNSKVLLTLLAAESIIVFIYDGAFIAKPGPEGVSFAAFDPSNLFVGWGGLAAVLVIVVTAFIGFEAAPVFAEESRDARRTIPLATFAGLGFMLFIYALTTWAITVATGPSNVVAAATADSQNLMFSLAGERLGAGLADAGSVLLITSAFAAMLSFHNTCARYSYALAREGVLPRGLAQTGARSGAPQASSALQSTLSLIVIIVYAIGKYDPINQLFFWGGALGGFGVVACLIATSLAVMAYFARRSHDESPFTWLIAPLLSAAALGVIFYEVILNFHNLLGVAEDNPLRWIFPAVFAGLFVIGAIWALTLRSSKPDLYSKIGLGAEAAASVDLPGQRFGVDDALAARSADADTDVSVSPSSPRVIS
jgi:amino acid transporter